MDNHFLSKYCWEIINAMSDGLLVTDRGGKIVMVNEAMERLTGFAKNELEGADCTLLNCDACEILRAETQEEYCMLFEIGRVKGKRCIMLGKNGDYVPVIKNASLLKDQAGAVIGAIETMTDISELDDKERRIEELSRLLDADKSFHGMVGKSPVMRRIYQIIEKAAQSDAPVIVYGESGTGKEMVAQAIHTAGRRKSGPFIKFNCAALNEALLESELFGHVKGAFTGAYRHRQGRFEAAHGGDIFLDEIGDIPISTQAKLLRVIETKQFERVGDHRTYCVDARVISATNRDLSRLVADGRFRQDLFFRINVVPIYLPPLRERKEDIPLLINEFMIQLRKKTGKDIHGVSSEVMGMFAKHDWPGNVRELRSSLEYAFVVAEGDLIEKGHLPDNFGASPADPEKSVAGKVAYAVPEENVPELPMGAMDEKTALIEALRASNGNRTKAGKILGVHRMTVWNRMKKYGIQ